MNERTTNRRIAAVTATTTATIALAALLATAQTPATQPTNATSGDASGAPANAPTTQQAAYDRLLGGDENRSEKPILPTARPTVDRTTGAAAVAPGAPQMQTRREGSYIVNQTGRLARSSDGQGFEFTFNADGSALQDPPMKVLPNLKLGVMEDTLESTNRDLQFRITGMVTEYRGRNYILLEKVVVVQDVK